MEEKNRVHRTNLKSAVKPLVQLETQQRCAERGVALPGTAARTAARLGAGTRGGKSSSERTFARPPPPPASCLLLLCLDTARTKIRAACPSAQTRVDLCVASRLRRGSRWDPRPSAAKLGGPTDGPSGHGLRGCLATASPGWGCSGSRRLDRLSPAHQVQAASSRGEGREVLRLVHHP